MHWFFELKQGLQAASVLTVCATFVLLFAARLRAALVGAVAVVVPLLAALVLAAQSLPAQGAPANVPVLLVLGALLVGGLLLRRDELANETHLAECAALQLLGGAGAAVLVEADDLLSLLLGFEAMSLAVVVLGGLGRGNRPVEAAFKFFVLATAAAATLIYGMGLQVFATGSFALAATPLASEPMQRLHVLGAVMVVLGVAFELAIVPMHFGTLGLLLAAPIPCVQFASTVSKVGAAFALAKLTAGSPVQQQLLQALGVLTIVWATFGGLAQKHLRGLLGYSAVAHGGFLCLAVGCGAAGHGALLYYAVVYAASVGLVFAGLSGTGLELPLGALGKLPLGRQRSVALVAGLMSLAGIPPLPGFWSKLGVLRASWDAVGPVPTVVAALGGVFGALYYLRPVPDLLAGLHRGGAEARTSTGARVAIAIAGLVVLLGAVLPGLAAAK